MPFEPLRTDERLETSGPRPKDFDTQMLLGCSGFVTVSLLTYFLTVWPHLAFPDTYRLSVLMAACAAGMLPAAILGIVAMRKFGLPGGGGFVGGALAASIFLHLNLKRLLLLEELQAVSRELPQPEYPASWQFLVPGAWLLGAVVLALVFLRREEFSTEEGSEVSPRA
jgi:hypothetical protein